MASAHREEDIVVSGWDMVTPLGTELEEQWAAFEDGRSGAGSRDTRHGEIPILRLERLDVNDRLILDQIVEGEVATVSRDVIGDPCACLSALKLGWTVLRDAFERIGVIGLDETIADPEG